MQHAVGAQGEIAEGAFGLINLLVVTDHLLRALLQAEQPEQVKKIGWCYHAAVDGIEMVI